MATEMVTESINTGLVHLIDEPVAQALKCNECIWGAQHIDIGMVCLCPRIQYGEQSCMNFESKE